MDIKQLEGILKKGEDSFCQFKTNFTSIDNLAVEIAAFANSQGGKIIVGVDDLGTVIGLSMQDVQRLNQWISNASAQKIEPPLFVKTEIILIGEERILIIDTPRGDNKPYGVNKNQFWVKNGADKRRASREELFRLMQSSSMLFADEMSTNVHQDDIDMLYFSDFYNHTFGEDLNDVNISIHSLLHNLKLVQDDRLTLAGLLLFGKNVAFHKPQFGIKATNYLTEDSFLDKEDIVGKLFEQHRKGIDFILRNLYRSQVDSDFNLPGQLEIPLFAIKEVVANALAHRDYFINSSVFINIWPDRVEILSPGVLPNTVNIENIKLGIHMERNPILLSFMAKNPNFGYTGRGSGIPRVLRLCKAQGVKVEFVNDTARNCFQVVFYRKQRAQKPIINGSAA